MLTRLRDNFTHFLEKSLKQSLNLFCIFVGTWFSSNNGVKNTVAISIGPWFTVVPRINFSKSRLNFHASIFFMVQTCYSPIHPCRTICSIFVSGGSCCIECANSAVFFCISSMATSIGVRTICTQEIIKFTNSFGNAIFIFWFGLLVSCRLLEYEFSRMGSDWRRLIWSYVSTVRVDLRAVYHLTWTESRT